MAGSVVTRRGVLGSATLAPLLASCAFAPTRPPLLNAKVDAPFDMAGVQVPNFRAAKPFPINDFGAAQDDQGRTTKALAQAINAAHRAGAGVVVVPPGVWPTGKIHLKSNVALHLAKGATLLFSSDPKDYLPAVRTSWEGLECYNYSPLVYAHECQNVAITGEGTLEARLDVWRDWYKRPKPHLDALVALYDMAFRNVPVEQRQMAEGQANLRPHFIQFNRCRNVLVEGVRIRNSPFWVLHPYLCRDVTIRRVDVSAHGHNNDGVDPEMSQNVLIEDCVFDQGDDAVSVKSGREFDAWRIGVPARNVVMRNCRIKNGHQLMAIGSELSGGIENVLVDDCHFVGDGKGADGWAVPIANILFVKTNERRGGFVRNIHLSNVSATQVAGGVLSVDTDVLYQWRTLVPTRERRLTPIEGLHLRDVRAAQAKFVCRIRAQAELPVRDVTLERVAVDVVTDKAVDNDFVRGFSMS